MKVLPLTRHNRFNCCFLGTQNLAERIGFFAGAGVSVLGPPIYCIFTGEFDFLWLIAGCDFLGIAIGYAKFKMVSNRFASCVPRSPAGNAGALYTDSKQGLAA